MARRIEVQLIGDDRSLTRAFKRSGKQANLWNSELVRASRGAFAATVGFGGLGRAVAFASGAFIGVAGLATAVKQSTSAFVAFGDTMQKTVGLAGVAQNQVAGLEEQILALAPAVAVGPQELAESLYFVTSAGIPAANAMKVLTVSAKAASAGLGSTQIVADALTSAINAYGQANLSAADAADVLVATVRLGKGEADRFAPSIGNVAAVAAQLGVSFNDVGAGLAAITRLGVDAETASIEMQQVFTNLLKVTPQAAKAFHSVGLSAGGLRKVFAEKGMLAGLQLIKDAFGNNMVAIAKAFPNIRALRGMLALVGKQSNEVNAIFAQMADTSNSLQTAFDAVSKDAAFKFRQMRAAVAATGIAVGAAFAPLAVGVASAVTKASQRFLAFTKQIGEAHGFKAKLNVVWEGLDSVATNLTRAMQQAVGNVDWTAVWAGVGDIGASIEARIKAVDWNKIGDAIGRGLNVGITRGAQTAKAIANKISDVMGQIDWEQIGRKIGPGLATAVLSGLKTLLDPAFWLRNWDLILAVGFTVFGGAVGKVAGKLGAPLVKVFARLGGDVVLALASGIERYSPRLAGLFLTALSSLPRLAGAALAPLENAVGKRFKRLGGITRFVVKVLGIDAAIHLVSRFATRVYDYVKKPFGFLLRVTGITSAIKTIGGFADRVIEIFGVLKNVITGQWRAAFDGLKRLAIKAALDIVEPFSHLPSWLGGGPFRDMKTSLQNTLAEMDASSARTAANIAGYFGETAVLVTAAFNGVGAAIAAAYANMPKPAGSTNRAAGFGGQSTPNERQGGFPTGTSGVSGGGGGGGDGGTAKGFTLPFRLRLEQLQAAVSGVQAQMVKAARDIVSFIRSRLPHLKGEKLLDALGQLESALGTIRDAAKDAADKAKETADKAKQFAVPLGLQLDFARSQALGKDLTPVLKKMRAAAQRALKSGRLGIQGQIDAWDEIFNVNQQLGDQATQTFKKISATKAAQGLGLTGSALQKLQDRLSIISSKNTAPASGYTGAFGYAIPVAGAGGPDIVVHSNLYVDGQKVATNTTKHQQKRARRNPPQKRGPNASGR